MTKLKYLTAVISFFSLIFSCSEDDVDCAAVSCIQDSFQVILTDDAGTNLIDNGTFNPNEITVIRNGEIAGNVANMADTGLPSAIWLTLERAGNTDFEIRLNQTETDMLSLSLFIESTGACCGPNFSANSAVYNGVSQTIQRGFSGFIESITVIR